MSEDLSSKPLEGRRIGVPESRELDLFAAMLEERGADVYRCPLVAIKDSPDRASVEAWLRDFAAGGYQDLILLTGEGLRRLLGFAERAGGPLREDFIDALSRVRKITRGPKPANALRKIGLKSDLSATVPTTEGVMESLSGEELAGRKVGVQLYGSNPNLPLVNFLRERGAEVHTVAPYVYADDVEDSLVEGLIAAIVNGDMDAVAFTSSPQVTRLLQMARRLGREKNLLEGLNRTLVAAVGPVVAASLEDAGVEVKIMPESTFFMKPLVRQLVVALGR